MTPLDLSIDQALVFRLARQHLLAPAADPVAAAGRLLGAQAQVHSAAVLQLRARSPATTAASVGAALFAERRLVKLWAQRSTLHLTPVEDLPLVLALRREAVARYRAWLAESGLSAAQIDALIDAIVEALQQAPQSRADLAGLLAPRLGEWARPWLTHSWGGALKLAATMGLVCHGPDRPREATFVHLPSWCAVPPAEEGAALAALGRRYLASYGPAAPRDLAKFAGVSVSRARDLFDALRPELVEVAVEGRPAWALAADEAALRQAEMPPSQVTVLPHFDPYLLAHADTAPFVPVRRRTEVYRTAGWISPVVLVEGRVAATWSATRQGGRWQVVLTPFRRLGRKPLKAAERRLADLASAVGVGGVALSATE